MSEQRTYDRCDFCGNEGELGKNLRAHAVEVPGKTHRVVRLLHVGACRAEWFEKYTEWLKSRSASSASGSESSG